MNKPLDRLPSISAVRKLMQAHSTQELATRFGMSYATWYRWKKALGVPTRATRLKACALVTLMAPGTWYTIVPLKEMYAQAMGREVSRQRLYLQLARMVKAGIIVRRGNHTRFEWKNAGRKKNVDSAV